MDVKIYDFYKLYNSTHKVVGSKEYIDYALEKGADTISVISSGNLSSELLKILNTTYIKKNIPLLNLVNKYISPSKNNGSVTCGRILRDAPEREKYLASYGKSMGVDFGKIVDVTDFIPKAYDLESEKILDSSPNYVSVPIGSGKFFISIYNKIKQLNLDTKLIGFLPVNGNGIFSGGHHESNGYLFYRSFTPKSIADKLITPYVLPMYRSLIIEAMQSGHIVHEMSLHEERTANAIACDLNAKTEASSATSFYVLNSKFQRDYSLDNDSSIVVVNTGKGSKKPSVIDVPIYAWLK